MPFNTSSIQKVIRSLAKPAVGVLRYVLTLSLFCGVWWYDARLLNRAFDLNLTAIKALTALFDGSGKAEAMLRSFSAEKMLLFGEGSAIIWGIGKLTVEAIRRWFIGPGRPACRPAAFVPQPIDEFHRRSGNR